MQQLHEIATETWRLIVLRDTAAELLVLENGSGFSLPSVEIPQGGRVARDLNDRLKSVWNLDAFSLYPLLQCSPSNGHSASRSFVVETIHPDAPAVEKARWLPVSGITDRSFAHADDAIAIHQLRADIVTANADRSSIGSVGTFARIRTWVRRVLEPSGVNLGEQFLQINATKNFSLVRFETDTDPVWFKAVGEPNVREFPITVALSNLFPSYTAPLLATEPRWNAWLASEVPGVPLSQHDDVEAWSRSAHDLAALQIASMGTTQTILKWNPRDVRTSTLFNLVRPFFEFLCELMGTQATPAPAPLSLEELDELEIETRHALSELQSQNFSDTLGHLDLNPDNLVALPQRTVFLDWAEASVGHPFLSFAYLLEHFRTQFHDGANGLEQLVRNYLDAWRSQARSADTERAICLALFIAIFAHAVSTDVWRDAGRPRAPRLEGYYRSLARRMKLYAGRIRNGASNVSDLWN